MDSEATELRLPPNLPYPIKIIKLETQSGKDVKRGARLLDYSYVYRSAKDAPEVRFGTWDSPVDGTLSAWYLKVSDTVSSRRAVERPALSIIEPCKHGLQIGGLCGICGKDMTDIDYMGFSDASRAGIQMTHSASGPTVSLEEAQKLEHETTERLQAARRLSLIVDLDQTIVHATVDPTVGEWISEGEAWEARKAKREARKKEWKDEETHSNSEESDDDLEDIPANPNWHALQDVKHFRLPAEFMGGFPPRAMKQSELEGPIYYIKPRPGCHDFLRTLSEKYEMHVYTMGTRAYAEQVCKIIDPDGGVFSGRILSRDESGSLTQKSLRRLFPCDQSMVVVIDDRADVWGWSPNLIKVIPYDFFVGIGDINSAFLPKLDAQSLGGSIASGKESTSLPSQAKIDSLPVGQNEEPVTATPIANEAVETALLNVQTKTLEAQLEERPLAKKQEELIEHEQQEEANNTTVASNAAQLAPKHDLGRPARHALLHNDDRELVRVKEALEEVHRRFYAGFDKQSHARSRNGALHDVTRIIPQLRSEVFEGVHILFSSVIPLDTVPTSSEIWRMACRFGATCHLELNDRVTHVVANKRGTVKVDAARKRGGCHIVWLAWLSDSIARCQRQPEDPYYLDEPPDPNIQPVHLSTVTLATSATHAPEALDNVDWDAINAEVDAAMEDSGDDTDGDATEEGSSVNGSAPSTPRAVRRKRGRSSTPSETNDNDSSRGDELLRSPLAKRKRLTLDRAGSSKLKEAISAEDMERALNSTPSPKSPNQSSGSSVSSSSPSPNGLEEADDFLADAFNSDDDDG